MVELLTASDVVNALGGTKAVAEFIGRTDPAVSNWRKRDRFPANTYTTFKRELDRRRLTAPDVLWCMREDA